jgi:arginase
MVQETQSQEASTSQSRRYTIIKAPSVLGLKPSGVEKLPEALLAMGLAESIRARRVIELRPPPFQPGRDPETGVQNADSIVAWSPKLADAVGTVIRSGEFPVVLGGDCSVLLGSMLALRRRGRYGLLFIDGHADFYQPEAEPCGEAASMELALTTGYGPERLTDWEGRRPLVRPIDVFLFGHRDGEEQKEHGSQLLPSDLRALDLDAIRQLGSEEAARRAVEHLTRGGATGFFIHLDADSLADEIMPAVDYRLPGGLLAEELSQALALAVASEEAVGLEITTYNPSLDEDGAAGRVLADTVAAALGGATPVAR